MNTATVTEISGPNGEEMELIVVNRTGVVADDSPCPTDDLEEKAEEIADEIVDEIEEEIVEEAKPEPEPESESSESEEEEPAPPAKKKIGVYKTTVETMGEDPFALTNLVAAAKGKPVILDFQYDECGHCQEIAPEYEQMMFDHAGTSENPLAYFRKVDIFQHRARLADWGIKRFPTFKVFALGHEISHLEGKDAFHSDLADAIEAAFVLYEDY
jgi:thiol-disulfide isomerase/thioredoxin